MKRDENGRLQVHLEIEEKPDAPFIEQEESLARLLNETGLAATGELLSGYDKGPAPLTGASGKKVYLKGVVKKNTKRSTGR